MLYEVITVNTCQQPTNPPFDDNAFEISVLDEARTAIKHPDHPIRISRKISNLNRSFGARISGEIAQYYGDAGLKDGTINIMLKGIAGHRITSYNVCYTKLLRLR